MQSHTRHFQHVGGPEGVPGVHHTVMSESDIDAGRHQFRHPGHPTPFGINILSPLDGDVDQRIGDGMHSRFRHQGNQLTHIVVIHRMHRRQMRSGHPPLESKPQCRRSQALNMA